MKHAILSLGLLALCATSCTKESGTLNVSYVRATALYGDIEQIRQTPLIAPSRSIVDPGKVFVGSEILLVGEENKGIHVFDNSNPVSPVNLLFIDLPFTKEFFVHNNVIYAESHYDMVKVDISDMNAPSIVSRLEFALADPIKDDQGRTLLGFSTEQVTESIEIGSEEMAELEEDGYLYWDFQDQLIPHSSVPASFAGNGSEIGTINRIAWAQDHVYVIGMNTMHVFSDQSGMLVKTSEHPLNGGAETIYPDQQQLFIGTRTSVEIYRTTDPAAPEYVSSFNHVESCDPVYPHGDVAYSTLRTGDETFCPGNENALIVLDVSNLASPQLLEEIPMVSPYGLTVDGDRLYVGEGGNGMRVYDITDATDPVELLHDATTAAYDIIMHPTIPHLLLTTGPNGIEQYEQDPSTLSLTLVSSILF